jgi:hypothetical protein
MRFATAQWPDPEHSQDRVFVTDRAAVVLDGASAFVPVDVPTQTYVDTLGAEITRQLEQEPTRDLVQIMEASIADAADGLDLERGAAPSSTVSIVRVRGDVVDLYALGDSAIYYGGGQETVELTDDRIAHLGIPEHREYRERLALGHGYDGKHRELLKALQRQQARYRNRPGGYWIAEADPAAARHALTQTMAAHEIAWAVLATDGAYGPMAHLGLDDWPRVARLSRQISGTCSPRARTGNATPIPMANSTRAQKSPMTRHWPQWTSSGYDPIRGPLRAQASLGDVSVRASSADTPVERSAGRVHLDVPSQCRQLALKRLRGVRYLHRAMTGAIAQSALDSR